MPEAKLEVPSNGSTIHVYSELLLVNPLSSDIMLWEGNLSLINVMIVFSLSISALVTMLL